MDRIRNCIVSEYQRNSGATNVTVKLCDLMIKMTFCIAGWWCVDRLLHVVISMGPQLLLERVLGWVHCVLGWDTQVALCTVPLSVYVWLGAPQLPRWTPGT